MTAPISDADAVIVNLPDLTIEVSHTEDMVILQQGDYSGEFSRLALHKWQVRMLAEHFGLLPAAPRVSEGETVRILRVQLADSARTVSTLVRRMKAMKKRVDHLGEWLCTKSDHEHANLDYEMDYANATCDINDEFCVDLDDLEKRFGLATVSDAATQTEKRPQLNTGEPAGPRPASAVSASKACVNPYGETSAKASVKPSGNGCAGGTGSLFGGAHG